jgi:hypothetical protein
MKPEVQERVTTLSNELLQAMALDDLLHAEANTQQHSRIRSE